jgi:hypothetical protein
MSDLGNATFILRHGLSPARWELTISGTFTLSELPKLKQLLDIYASLAETPTAALDAPDALEGQTNG